MKRALLFSGLIFFLLSCGSGNKNAGNEQKEGTPAAVKPETEKVKTPKINADSLVKVIEAENARIESNLKSLKRIILKTTDLRAQVKQKWSEINYYTENGKIVKVVTLPYPQISKRTEEFTYLNGKLILALIADNGIKESGEQEKQINKEYYYFNDNCFKEDNRSKEKETTIRNSDSERLLQEGNEYLDLFPKK